MNPSTMPPPPMPSCIEACSVPLRLDAPDAMASVMVAAPDRRRAWAVAHSVNRYTNAMFTLNRRMFEVYRSHTARQRPRRSASSHA